jgi:WD40 repeat protein
VDPNYLACGLDKTRSEYSLLIWDLADVISRAPDSNGKPFARPLDRLEVRTGATALSGVVSGSATPTASDTSSQPRHIQHYCPSETVNSVSFLHSELYHLLASSSNKIIRLFDLRSPANINTAAQTAGTASWTTRAVWGLSPDPTNEHRFASYEDGGQGLVRIWDRRRPGADLLGFEAGGGGVCQISWETGWTSRGRLGVATREGGVSVWDVISGQSPKDAGRKGDDWSILASTKTTPKPDQPLQSFTFAYGSSAVRQTNILVLSRDGTMGIGALGESSQVSHANVSQAALMLAGCVKLSR